jgi:ferredoxin-NADP reductase
MQHGEFSNWVFDQLQEQDAIEIQGPMGHCHYQAQTLDTPMLMVAGGTGLAPLLGVIREALASGHRAAIHLYHQAASADELYLHDYLCDLALRHEQLKYFPCIPQGSDRQDVFGDSARNLIHHLYADLKRWQVYLAGSPAVVAELQREILSRGVRGQQILADPFDMKELRRNRRDHTATSPAPTAESQPSAQSHVEVEYPAADPEIWQALEQGRKLYKILQDFYDIVYEDPRLSPFFQKVTRQRSIEKVYLFLRQVFSGEKVYFGDRPRNAHHWMVISDDLFDHREDIMEGCLRDNGLPEHLIKRWRCMEESFRPDIVKSKPWSKVMHGVELPLEGYQELVLDSGSLCDSCQQAIDAGTRVRYHVRLGSIYCPACMAAGKTSS